MRSERVEQRDLGPWSGFQVRPLQSKTRTANERVAGRTAHAFSNVAIASVWGKMPLVVVLASAILPLFFPHSSIITIA